jgi:very-short-patch-repair endonuclease
MVDVYHANPKLYKKDENPHPYLKHLTSKDIWDMDNYKKELAEEKGFEILTVWESEYKDNPDEIIRKCKEFINER